MAEGDGFVRLSGRLICGSAGDVEMVRAHLPEHTHLTLAEPGCLSFSVVPSDDPMVWLVDECFRDRAAFVAHQQRTRASAWWAATAAIPRQYQITGMD